MNELNKIPNLVMPLRDLPRVGSFPFRASNIGWLRGNWHDNQHGGQGSMVFGITLGARGGMIHREINGEEVKLRCPVVCVVRPGDKWRNLSPDPWDELYISTTIEGMEALDALGAVFEGHRELTITSGVTDAISDLTRLLEDPHGSGNADRIDCAAWRLMMECRIALLAPSPDDPAERIVREAASWIRLNYRERLDLSAFLRGRGITYRTFMRKWRAMFDKPPSQYALDLRLDEGRRLLRETKLSVEAVAATLKIDDPLYFSRFFRRREGVSPRQYRASHR